MNPRVTGSALWGLVGGLSFLVLVQGYELLAGTAVGVAPKAGLAVAVAVVAAVATYLASPRLYGNERA